MLKGAKLPSFDSDYVLYHNSQVEADFPTSRFNYVNYLSYHCNDF